MKVDGEKVWGFSFAEDRTGGVAAPCFRLLIGRPDPGERDHRCQSTISRWYVCRAPACDVDPRFLRQRGARSATRRGRAAIYRVPSIENSKSPAAYLGVCGRISAIPCRSRSRNRLSEFGSTDPTQERSDVLLPGTSFNAFRNSKRVLRGSAWLRQLITKPFLPRRKRAETSTVTQSPLFGARGDAAGKR